MITRHNAALCLALVPSCAGVRAQDQVAHPAAGAPPILPVGNKMAHTDVGDTLAEMKIRAEHRRFNFPYLADGATQSVSLKYGPTGREHERPRSLLVCRPGNGTGGRIGL